LSLFLFCLVFAAFSQARQSKEIRYVQKGVLFLATYWKQMNSTAFNTIVTHYLSDDVDLVAACNEQV
jgi:hypothetical protein